MLDHRPREVPATDRLAGGNTPIEHPLVDLEAEPLSASSIRSARAARSRRYELNPSSSSGK
jgi:hypothetical protein